MSDLPLYIDTHRVDEIAASIGGHQTTINETLTALRGLNTDLASAWDGSAQNTFEATYGDWITQLERYSETLTSVQGYLKSVAENFRQLDAAARQAASGATMPE
jgi:WXG100 family type VII secretion target